MLKKLGNISLMANPTLVFLLIGFIFMVVNIGFAASEKSFREQASEVTATIVEVQPEIIVEFVTQEQERIRTTLYQRSSDMKLGAEISIYYDRDDPQTVKSLEVIQVLNTVFGMIGGSLFLAGLVFAALLWLEYKRGRRLREVGRRLYVRVEEARIDTAIRVKGRHPHLLIGRALVEGQQRIFQYRGFFADPQALVGKYLTVYYDMDDPDKYTVDAPEALDLG